MPEEVLKNIYRLPIPLEGNPLKELNAYLIQGEDRNLLIDTGFGRPSCREALFSQLRELGVEPGQVDVLLTHLHSDHTGLCRDAAGETGKVYISRADDLANSRPQLGGVPSDSEVVCRGRGHLPSGAAGG